MNEKKQIVDNPLLLTSLFSEGIFYIPNEGIGIVEEVINVENQQVEVAEIASNDSKIEIENTPISAEIKKIEIPESTVINIIIDPDNVHWPEKLTEPLTKMMGAIRLEGKPLTLSDFAVYNLTLFPEVTDISKFISQLKTQRVIIWSTKLKTDAFSSINNEYTLANKQVLWLKDILDVMINNESKMEAWIQMKKFFKM
jgi:hypothetical protein